MKRSIYIIGAGQLGSRHLQALKQVQTPLQIIVVDPSNASLATARERYEGTAGVDHAITFLTDLPSSSSAIDIAIFACNAHVRKQALEKLLDKAAVQYLVLEKLLFDKIEDYASVSNRLENLPTKTFVNCAMRMIPFYGEAKSYFQNQNVTLTVNGSKFGLASNAIHYLDLLAFYSQDSSYVVQVESLDPEMIDSKRPGFKELTGTLIANYSKGSRAILTCLKDGTLPFQVEISSPRVRLISREWEQKAWISEEKNGWKWIEVEAKIPFQSQLTAKLVDDLLTRGSCDLVPFAESKQIHLNFLLGLKAYFKSTDADVFPFT
jgi:hypothetical protein